MLIIVLFCFLNSKYNVTVRAARPSTTPPLVYYRSYSAWQSNLYGILTYRSKATGTSARNAVVPVARCSQSRDCCIGNHLLVFVVSPLVSSHFQTENVLRERSFHSIHLPRSECHPKVMIALFAKRKVKMHSQRLKQMLHDLICQMTHV